MKRILTLAVAVVAMASCKKENLEPVDVIRNQGTTEAIVNGIVLSPNQKVITEHVTSYIVECTDGCKININGNIFYRSGSYDNPYKKMGKL